MKKDQVCDTCKCIQEGGTSPSSRIGYVDALKGFVMLCVVLSHIAHWYLKDAYSDAEALLYYIYAIIALFHMPLFMMISGYVYYTAYFNGNGEPDRKRLNHQIYNLIGVYVIFDVLCGFSKFFAGTAVHVRVTLLDIALIGIKPIDAFWYLYTLILLYIIFSIKRLVTLNKWMLLGVLIVASVCRYLINIGWFAIGNLLYYELFFFIGITGKRNKNWIIGNRLLTSVLFCISVVLCTVFWDAIFRGEYINHIFIVSFVIALGVSLALWYLFEHISFLGNCSFFKLLGKHSLEIYVMHTFSVPGLELVFFIIGINNVYVSTLLNLLISVSAPILISQICYKLGIHGLFFKPFTYLCARNAEVDNGQ